MKFSSALSLGLAPLAMAKAVHNVYPVKRDLTPIAPRDGHNSGRKQATQAEIQALQALGLTGAGVGSTLQVSEAQVIIIWVCPGQNQATTQINQQQTVTVTQTVVAGAGGGAAAPVVTNPAEAGASAPATVVAGAAATHTVNVGGPKGLQFEPPEIKAAVGDMVVFNFLSQNHTATQSAFDTPCDPLAGGMDSGFQANANNTINPPPQVAMQVMVATPLWFYCRQNNHCGKGMVFSINPTAEKTHAMFQALAIAQKGTGTGSAITGNAPAGGAGAGAAAGGVAASQATTAVAGQATLAPLPGATAPAGGASQGVGQLNPDGSCTCAVICGAGSFPAAAVQGLNAFGGMPGSLPASMVGAA